jgi:hypothetical protein
MVNPERFLKEAPDSSFVLNRNGKAEQGENDGC